jgi:hypothetical protein
MALNIDKCNFIKKDGEQCTNKKKEGDYCGIHKKYAVLGISEKNRCNDCGQLNNDKNYKNCEECRTKRNIKSKEKRAKLKSIKIEKQIEELKIDEYEISPYYLSGFFDGDGSICINEALSLQIQFSQCVLPILNKIKDIFGGSLYSFEPRNDNQRTQHSLRICGRDCEKILKYLDIGCIMKYEQVQVAKKIIYLNNLQNLNDKKIEYREEMRRLNKSYKKTHDKPYTRINIEYISGLFDAEGCIYLRERKNSHCFDYIKITQANDYQLLEHIKNFIGHGSVVDKIKWTVNRQEFVEYDLTQMLPFLNVKKLQAELCLEFLNCNDNLRKKEIYQAIKDDKHLDC